MLLQEIAEEAGYSASHVASLSGLHLSTVVRHWQDAHWFDHLDGGSLKKLIAALPGVEEYIRVYPHLCRQHQLAEQHNLASLSTGKEPYRRVRISKAD